MPVLLYLALTEVIVLVKKPELFLDKTLVFNRFIFLFAFTSIFFLTQRVGHRVKSLVNILTVYALLALLYKETAILNQLFYPVMDPILQAWDEWLFGFQPALQFSESRNHPVFSELMFFGYFSYYLLPLVALSFIWIKMPQRLEEFGFVLIGSFLVYYSLFIFFPAVGPQFFWDAPDNVIDARGLFSKIVKTIQLHGEAPTAAFPSSHVGISIIILLWLKRYETKFYLFLVPTTLLLILATVYIKAHYVTDVIGGLISAPVVYLLVRKCYFRLRKLMWS